jgi:hypothetical protein
MKKIIFFIFAEFFFSCSSPENKVTPKEKFDQLEYVFSVANWKLIEGTDTSYWYFSRLGDLTYNVYNYKLINGDSSLQDLSMIRYQNNKVTWPRLQDTLVLVSADSTSSVWSSISNDKLIYNFNKVAEDQLSLDLPGNKKIVMKKTLPLATFLVRSRYDFLNNTHTVDSPIVPPRGKPLPSTQH